MALRRLALSLLRGRAAPGRWLPAAMIALAPGAASAQYMALTAPPKPDARHVVAPDAPKPAPHEARPGDRALAGHLPHQRTGPSRPRVVRDICIGCDR